MGLIQTFKDKLKERDKPLDIDEDGKVLFREQIISDILTKLEERREEKLPLELQWRLNSNFLAGNQYCDINPYRRTIEPVEALNDYLERETFNLIAPLAETRRANLKKISYVMRVKPATNEPDDYSKAEVSTAILQSVQKNTDFVSKKDTMVSWSEVTGNCFILSWWDKNGGNKVAEETILEVDENGIESKKTTAYYEGELDYGMLTPYEVFPESIFKQGVESQRSIIVEQVKTADEVYDLYDIKVEGREIDTFALSPVGGSGGFGYEATTLSIGHRAAKNSVKVVTYFEKPSKHKPNGLMVIIVDGEHIVYYGDLPYSRIPIVQIISKDVPGQFFGKSFIEDEIPKQRAYNGCVNRIHEHIKRVAIGSYFAREGSIDLDEFAEKGQMPGEIVQVKGDGDIPTPIQTASLSQEIMQERYNLKNDMEYVAGVSQLMVNGATPSGVTSGTAISNLREIDNTRLSLTGDHIRDAIRQLAILWLEIYKKYAVTKRVIDYVGKNDIGNAIVWSRDDITSYDVEYTTENELLISEEMQQQAFQAAYTMGFFTDENGIIPERVKHRAIEGMKAGDYSDIMSINTLQMQAAQRENILFESGVIPEISELDNHALHIEEHMRYALQMDYHILKMKKPEYARILENHIRQHKEISDRDKMENIIAAQDTPQ